MDQSELDAKMAENFVSSVAKHTTSLDAHVQMCNEAVVGLDPKYLSPEWLDAMERAAARSIGDSVAIRWLGRSPFTRLCGSPLESVLLLALHAYGESVSGESVETGACSQGVHWHSEPRHVDKFNDAPYHRSLVICVQHKVEQYAADFMVLGLGRDRDQNRRERHIAVEVDGHEFHERTKEQAAHDKKRDRAFQAAGYYVFRYTGSEVFRDPMACAKEVVDFALFQS